MKNEKYYVVILSVLIMVFSVHIGTSLFNKFQYDATDENVFTLSEGSKEVLKKLSMPLKVKLYYSKTAANKGSGGIAAFNTHYTYVKDFLKQYTEYAGSKLTVEIIDPRPDSRDEEDAIAYGLKKFNLTETETYFFGLVVENNSGSEKIIEFINPNNKSRFEYEVTKLIYSATDPKKKRVGVFSSLKVIKEDISPYMAQLMRFQNRQVEESWQIIKTIKEFYDVVEVNSDATELPGLDILMIIHPNKLSDRMIYNIDQFVVAGGKVMLFVDPMALAAQSHEAGKEVPPDQMSSALPKLLKYWGISYDRNEFVGDKLIAGSARFNPNMPPVRALPLIQCRDICYQPYQDSISSSLGMTSFIFSGALKIGVKHVGLKYFPILSTTSKGNTYKASQRELQNPQGLWSSFKEGTKPVVMGYKVVGPISSLFSVGIEVDELVDGKTIKKRLDHIAQSVKPSAFIVFADVDFITDAYAYRRSIVGYTPSNDNVNLVLNSLETLAGSTDLLLVRSKPNNDRSFQVITEIELQAQKKTAAKVKEINQSIQKTQREFNILGKQANSENMAVIQSEVIKKKKELSKKIGMFKRELRDVKRDGREKVESLGSLLQAVNTLMIPMLVLLFGFFVHYRRRSFN